MTMHAKPLLALMILSSLALTACAERVRLSPLPADLTHCAEEPEAPALLAQDWTDLQRAKAIQITRDTSMLDYVLGLRSWGGDCQAKVAGAKAWNETVGGGPE